MRSVVSRPGCVGLAVAILVCAIAARPAVAFSNARNVRVLGTGADEAGSFCADFVLTGPQAVRALRDAKPIAKQDYLDAFEFLPCFVRGSAIVGGAPVRWQFRAGGNGMLTYADGREVFIGCGPCRKRFGASSQ